MATFSLLIVEFILKSIGFRSLTLSQTSPANKSAKNAVGKGEIARNEQFLLFPQCFLPVWRTFCHFHQI